MSREISRRTAILGTAGVLGLSTLGLSACSSGGGNIRFAWYGGSERQQAYNRLLELFMEQHSEDIVVEPEYADYDPYQDRMATQFAAGDAPDLFFLAGFNIMEYHAANQYHDLEEFVGSELDLTQMDPDLVEAWKIDGRLTAMPYAFWNTVVRYNVEFADEAGIELPDDESWTWDDFAEVCKEYAQARGEGHYGTVYEAYADLPFNAFLRQGGQELFTLDGEVGFDAEGFGDWMNFWETLREEGGAISLSEQEGVTASDEVVSTRTLFRPGNANHLANAQPGSEWELDVRLCPTLPDPAAGHRFLHTVRFAMYNQTEDPELSAELMSFLLNSEHVPELLGQNQGLQTALHLQDVAKDIADETGRKIIDIIEREQAMEMRPRAEVPAGAGAWRSMMGRAIEAIALDGADITTEGQRLVDDLTQSIQRAND